MSAENTNVSQDPVHQEGIDHIKSKLDERGTSTAPTSTSADDTTTAEQPASIIDTVKSYLGYGTTSDPATSTPTTDSTTPGTTSSSISQASRGAAAAVSSGITSAAAYAGLTPAPASSNAPGHATDTTSSAPAANPTTDDTTTTTGDSSSSSNTTATNVADDTQKPTADAPKDPESGAKSDPAAADSELKSEDKHSADEGEQSKTKKHEFGGVNLENKDSIPTAGGQRLGESHWGESKVVPERPKAEGEDEDGADDVTKANSAKNADGEAHGDKGHLSDKIKDKLPFHKKD